MARVVNKILELVPALQKSPRVFVSAFGKHPGWSDHISDIPAESPQIEELRRLLYTEGIGRQIDSGEWKKLEDQGTAIEWGHLILRRTQGEAVLARLWPSRDQVGRSLYPMVVCAQVSGMSPFRLIGLADEPLKNTELLCRSATAPAEVKQALDALRAELITANSSVPHDESGDSILRSLLADPLVGESRLLDVFTQLEDLLDPRNRRGFLPVAKRRSYRVRVPAPGAAPQSLCAWLRLLDLLPGLPSELLLITPIGQGWVDILLGEPLVTHFRLLRAGLSADPLAPPAGQDDPEARQRAREFLGAAKLSAVPAAAPADRSDPPSSPEV